MVSEGSRTLQVGFSLLSVRVMIELIAARERISESVLQRIFGETAKGFMETKSLLESLKVIVTDEQVVKAGSKLKELVGALETREDGVFARLLVRLIATSSSPFGEESRRIFGAFRVESGDPELWIAAFPGKYFAMRNLLIELDAIHVDHGKEKYLIGSPFFDTFIGARYSQGPSPKTLASNITRKEELGLRTEKQVLEHEKTIVGQRHQHMIRHVSLENTAAGFDIASVRVNESTGQYRLRLIEVKAVSLKDWQFTFTMNEIRTATENKDAYFLYLVPVVKGWPDVGRMLVLRDPTATLDDSGRWIIQHGDWKVRRAA